MACEEQLCPFPHSINALLTLLSPSLDSPALLFLLYLSLSHSFSLKPVFRGLCTLMAALKP
uniref:Uncharacterized protein n=1 Tax=Rhizophora mucronata TaxID=61149 RepID=A0A2P2L2U6_RHIMU